MQGSESASLSHFT